MDFGTRIKSARLKKGWSIEQLAIRLGSTKSLISRYERNLVAPQVKTIEKLVNLLDLNRDEILVLLQKFKCLSASPDLIDIYIYSREDLFKVASKQLQHSDRTFGLSRYYFDLLKLNEANLIATTIVTEAMAPKLLKNDLVLIDLNATEFEENKIFTFTSIREPETIFIRTLHDGVGNKLLAKSYNQDYKDFEMDRSDINILGKVVYRSGCL